jgi:hypothetical protein
VSLLHPERVMQPVVLPAVPYPGMRRCTVGGKAATSERATGEKREQGARVKIER